MRILPLALPSLRSQSLELSDAFLGFPTTVFTPFFALALPEAIFCGICLAFTWNKVNPSQGQND